LFKQKGPKKPPRKEEVEATRMPMEAPFELGEKWEVGVVYHQDFGGGEISYFRADSLLKNKRWKGMAVDEYSGKQKKPRNITADEKTSGWEITPKDKIPKGLKEELEEAVNLKKLKKEYEENEDKNYHTENYLLLAKAFGTPAEVKKVEEILKKEQKQGQGSKVDFDWMYKNINPYYKKLRNEEVEIDEAKGTAYPATIDTLRKIVKDKQHQTVMFKSGQALVDLFTASAMVQVYDALKKPEMKKHFETMIKDKAGFMKTQAFAMKMIG